MRRLKMLRGDSSGSVAIEFAILAPVLITMLFGVLQIGLGMQNYNALRSVAAEAARYAVVERQKGVTYVASDVQAMARTIATGAPYGLHGTRLTVNCANATTQRVTGATEMTLTLTYNVPSFLEIMNMGDIPITFSRPVFVV
jgi:Flp pilus assembly protein TadG